jgi:eukaryotic-like serine/threonine-protein kinase
VPLDSDLDKQRVTEAMRRGWVRQSQVEECLLELNTADSILGALERRGILSPAQVRQLCGDAAGGNTMPDLAAARQGTVPEPGPGSGKVDHESLGEVLGEGDLINDRYLIEKLRRGGFGRVYLCTDMVSGHRCALKTLLREHLGSARLLEMFRKEVLLWIQLGDHPNIVLAFGMEEFMRLPFVVMECVDGGSLADLVERGPLGWKAAAGFGWQIANGLEYARQVCGLVHRDLKPANVLLTPDGAAKVTDFGISLVRGTQGEQLTGTPPYMPPEQWARPGDVDVRSDVYAFGVTLFELACGRRPFPDYSEARMESYRSDHLTKAPPDPRQFQPQMPEPMARLILRCLEKQQNRRPADFSVVRKELEPYAGPPPESYSPAPDRVGGLVNQSSTYFLLGRFEDAERTARQATRLDPQSVKARIALGNVLAERGQYREALKHLETAHGFDPSQSAPIVNSALYASRAGDRAVAERWLDLGLATLEPRQLESLSMLLIEFSRVPEAIRLCEEIVESNPAAIIAWNSLAIAWRRSGELDRAFECANRAVQINPRYAKGWSNRATILVQLGRLQEGLASADRALEFEPATAGAYAAKAAALGRLGRRAEGRACLECGLELLPGNALLLRALQQFT